MEILKEELLTLVKQLRAQQNSKKYDFNKKTNIKNLEQEIDRVISALVADQAKASLLSEHELKIQIAVLPTGEIRNRIVLPVKITAKIIIGLLNGTVLQINEQVKAQLMKEGIGINSPGYETRRDTMLIEAFIKP